jgi:cytochrome c oxidase assembly factor CtaG
VKANLSWTPEPGVLVLMALLAALYVPRWRAVRRSEGAAAAPAWRLGAFVAGLLAITAALISPVDSLADQAFLMHMVQHVLLLDVVPILLILSLTRVLLRPATRRLSALERQAGPLAHPAFAVVLYVATIWIWHAPALYDAALRHYPVHVLEHVSYALAGGLYWWHVLSPIRSRQRLSGLGVLAYMGSTKVLVGALGMGLAFLGGARYGYYAQRPQIWGLTASTDQAVAGVVMAVEQSIVMGIALAVLFVQMLTESEREQQRRERYELV